jgi:hypothetical protein
MTEAEWLASQNAGSLLQHLSGRVGPRKVRLAVCGCLRAARVWALLTSPAGRRAVEVSEAFADGAAGVKELGEARKRANAATVPIRQKKEPSKAIAWLANRACLQDSKLLGFGFPLIVRELTQIRKLLPAELPRDVLGNPFRTSHVQSAWLTSTLTSLATAAYEERSLPSGELDITRLAVLADALEDVGCQDAAILGHLRSPGPHVRGCWAVDLLLGKR